MPGKPKVDKDKVITLLKKQYEEKGCINEEEIIRDHWNDIRASDRYTTCTRQTISNIRKEAEKGGDLPMGMPHFRTGPAKHKRTIKPQPKPDMDLSTGVQYLSELVGVANEMPKLKQENWTLKNRVALLEEINKGLEKRVDEYTKLELQLKVAHGRQVTHGE